MRKISAVVFVLFFVVCGEISAQQKYGHINSNDILEAMPEYVQLKAALDNKQNQLAAQLQKMYADYEKKAKELQELGGAMMEAVREERTKELQTLQQSIAVFEENADMEVQNLQAKLIKPLNDKYLKIVQAVAKENGYAYIFDLASGSVAYHPENTGDVTALVKQKMGIN
jgi:outer membrane protein